VDDEEEMEEEELYCVCKQPDDGRHLVCCDNCEGWYHPECMGKTVEVPLPPFLFGVLWKQGLGPPKVGPCFGMDKIVPPPPHPFLPLAVPRK
jgi:hypothetical protein